jgi:hypothetical protein
MPGHALANGAARYAVRWLGHVREENMHSLRLIVVTTLPIFASRWNSNTYRKETFFPNIDV